MASNALKIGPSARGRHLSLKDFDRADFQYGYQYELGRGRVVVAKVPSIKHVAQAEAIREQFATFDHEHPGRIQALGGVGECKIRLPHYKSERQPDLAIYKTKAPEGKNVWAHWIPEIVIEVVWPESERCDYGEKREEYFAFGVREYWIFNSNRQELLVLHRRDSEWAEKTLHPPEVYCTPLLKGFEFRCDQVFK